MSSLACIVFSLWGLGLSVYRVGLFFWHQTNSSFFKTDPKEGSGDWVVLRIWD